MRVLVACEESQAVCKAFRELGHEAYSCDLQECSGGHPEWHIQMSVIPLLNGNCIFFTQDGIGHEIFGKWDLIIAHPPCTYLTVTGNRWFDVVKYGYTAQKRWDDRCIAICFFLAIAYADCERIAIENPVGCMSRYFRKPEQIINPYEFGDPFEKKLACGSKVYQNFNSRMWLHLHLGRCLVAEKQCPDGTAIAVEIEQKKEVRRFLASQKLWQNNGEVTVNEHSRQLRYVPCT